MRRGRQQRELDGVVVYVRNLADSHRILDLLTAEEGRIAIVARGGRASRRRFCGALDLFVSLRVQVQTGSGLWTLQAADVHDARVGIRASLLGLQRASLICECARLLTPEHHASPEMYAAVCSGLDCLSRGDVDAAASYYPLLLAAAGIHPDLGICSVCRSRSGPLVGVDTQAGGALCQSCYAKGAEVSLIPLIPLIPLTPLEARTSGSCCNKGVAQGIEEWACRWVERQTGRALKSRTSLPTAPPVRMMGAHGS